MEDQVRARFRKNYNKEIMIKQAYGMSESTLRVIASKLVMKPGSVGEVLPGIYCKVCQRTHHLLSHLIDFLSCLNK